MGNQVTQFEDLDKGEQEGSARPQEILPGLFLGSWKARHWVDSLQIHIVISITDPGLDKPLSTIIPEYIDFSGRFDIKEVCFYTLDDRMSIMTPIVIDGVHHIKSALENKRRILVHCMAGMSRSVTVVAGYLMSRDASLTANQALEQIRQKRSIACPECVFLQQLNALYKRVED